MTREAARAAARWRCGQQQGSPTCPPTAVAPAVLRQPAHSYAWREGGAQLQNRLCPFVFKLVRSESNSKSPTATSPGPTPVTLDGTAGGGWRGGGCCGSRQPIVTLHVLADVNLVPSRDRLLGPTFLRFCSVQLRPRPRWFLLSSESHKDVAYKNNRHAHPIKASIGQQ